MFWQWLIALIALVVVLVLVAAVAPRNQRKGHEDSPARKPSPPDAADGQQRKAA